MDEQANFKEKERETNKLASDLAMFQAGKGPLAVFQARRHLAKERAREAAVQAQKFGAQAGSELWEMIRLNMQLPGLHCPRLP